MARTLLRLVVPSPDGRRVLARPNGLAGWTLPVVAAPDDDGTNRWTDSTSEAAARTIGAPVAPVRRLDERTWEVRAEGRISAAGAEWVAADEAGRLGADADVVRRWATQSEDPLG